MSDAASRRLVSRLAQTETGLTTVSTALTAVQAELDAAEGELDAAATSLDAVTARVTAARELEWMTIKVVCWECNDDFARLMEIDDNLAGAELTALDTAVFLAERKRVYEKLHPETKAGAFKGNQHTGNLVNDTMSFTNSTAEKFGISVRQVERIVRAGSTLAGGDAHKLRQSERPVTLNDLSEIAKIGNVTERYRVIELLAGGKVRSAKDARRTWASEQGRGVTPPMNNTEKTWLRLQDAWRRAPKAGRVIFLEEHGDEVQALLDEIRGGQG